ncbi:MAG: DUF433 domain-containing protein [Caldilineaceae bacterium]
MQRTLTTEKLPIVIDPDIMSGTPVFAGTRVPIHSLIDHILAGDSLDTFLDGFPTVTRRQAEAVLTFAFRKAMDEVTYARAA